MALRSIDLNDGDVAILIVKDNKLYAKKCTVKNNFTNSFYLLLAGAMRCLGIDFRIDVTSYDDDSKKCGFRIIEKKEP